MIHTCIECKNYVPNDMKITGYKETVPGVLEPVYEEIPRHCSKCNEVMCEWYKKYGNTPSNQLTEDAQLKCYERPEYLKSLDNCIELAENILKDL